MLVLPNMGLYAWNHTLDAYDSQQLAGNFARLDDHDHSVGKGKQIPTNGIKDGAITPPKLAVGAIDTANINDGAVTRAKVAQGVVTVLSGVYASRPAAALEGRFFRATDLDVVYFDTGASWYPVPGLGKVPFCRASQASGTWNFASSPYTLNLTAAESYDEGTATEMHSTSTNPSRITIREAGVYQLSASVQISHPSIAGQCFLAAYFQKNGAGAVSDESGGSFVYNQTGGGLTVTVRAASTERYAVNDYIECKLARYGVMGSGDDSILGAYVTARYVGP